MRLVFIGLLVINVLVLGWHFLQAKEEPKATVRAIPKTAEKARPLTLLNEVDEDARTLLVREVSAKDDQSAGPICTLVGPYVDSDKGAIVRERLRSLGVESNLQSLEISAGESYWVYLPPEPSQEGALRKLHELQAKKIDSYVIPKGDLANGISFGVFTQKPLAEQRMADMRRQGYQAELKSIPRTQKELWLLLGPGQATRVALSVWAELVPKESGQEIRQNLCSAVASADKFH
ncbi:SPOR domain-containing protein [Simiduia litorea]|uniref:hypothetical protein n=1 Tax=Simiduia litorea TaxID=1435348 RepID=UPI0036F1D23E